MKNHRLIAFVLFAAVVSVAMGCAQTKAASSQQAIEQSKTMKTPDEQMKYLMGQANAFLNSKEYQDAINTATYLRANFPQNSEQAKAIITKATDEMKQNAQKAVGDMQKSFGGLGK